LPCTRLHRANRLTVPMTATMTPRRLWCKWQTNAPAWVPRKEKTLLSEQLALKTEDVDCNRKVVLVGIAHPAWLNNSREHQGAGTIEPWGGPTTKVKKTIHLMGIRLFAWEPTFVVRAFILSAVSVFWWWCETSLFSKPAMHHSRGCKQRRWA